MCTSVDCGRNPEYPEKTHVDRRKKHKTVCVTAAVGMCAEQTSAVIESSFMSGSERKRAPT